MNPFLTEKAVRKTGMLTILFLGCLAAFGLISILFGVVGGMQQGNLRGGMAAGVIGALLLLPGCISLIPAAKRRKAVRIAEAFREMRSGTVLFSDFSAATGIRDCQNTVRALLTAGYLQNIQVDFENARFILFTPKARMRWASGKKKPAERGRDQ